MMGYSAQTKGQPELSYILISSYWSPHLSGSIGYFFLILFTQYFKRDTQLADKLFYLMALCNKTIYIYIHPKHTIQCNAMLTTNNGCWGGSVQNPGYHCSR